MRVYAARTVSHKTDLSFPSRGRPVVGRNSLERRNTMTNFVPTWYALSGLATYGLNHETAEVARRSYVLYEGKYRNTEKIGEWKLLGNLTEEQLKEVKEILQRGNCPDGTIE